MKTGRRMALALPLAMAATSGCAPLMIGGAVVLAEEAQEQGQSGAG